MRVDLSPWIPKMFGFLLVLARVSGTFVFTPIPGIQNAPQAAKIVLSVAISVALIPIWGASAMEPMSLSRMTGSIAAEFTFGLLIGVSIALLLEGVQLAAQMIGLQAGYSFASTVDPSTQADSAVLLNATQLLAGLLFLAIGLDREVIRVLAYSLEKTPRVAAMTSVGVADLTVRLGSQVFVLGLRLALPVIAFLLLMDLSFAIVGKIHTQFQIMSLSFPLKMLAGLALLGTTLSIFPAAVEGAAAHTFTALKLLMGG